MGNRVISCDSFNSNACYIVFEDSFNSCALPTADEENAGLPDSFNSNACHKVAILPDTINSNACSTVIEDSVNPYACPTLVDEELQRFESSQLLSLDVLPFLKRQSSCFISLSFRAILSCLFSV